MLEQSLSISISSSKTRSAKFGGRCLDFEANLLGGLSSSWIGTNSCSSLTGDLSGGGIGAIFIVYDLPPGRKFHAADAR